MSLQGLGGQCIIWGLRYQHCFWGPGVLETDGVSGVPGTSMASSRGGAFWGSGYLSSLLGFRSWWPLVEQEDSARVMGWDMEMRGEGTVGRR